VPKPLESVPADAPVALAVSPAGVLHEAPHGAAADASPPDDGLSAAARARTRGALAPGTGHGLMQLRPPQAATKLAPALAVARGLGNG
jgi:hypothetical protein